jgi:tetratricopeptide (TPR) repeat protein
VLLSANSYDFVKGDKQIVAGENPKHEHDAKLLMSSMSKVFGPDYERYKKDLYISVQLYAARGFLREDEAEKLDKVIDAIFENNDTIAMLPYNTKLTEEGKEVLAGKVTAASTKWMERRIEWIKQEIEREYVRGFPLLTKSLRQIKMEDFFELDEAINKQEEAIERLRDSQAGSSKRQGPAKEAYLSKKSISRRDALKQAEDELVENLFKLNAFRDEYEKDWYAELTSDPDAFMKKVEQRRNVDHERYDIDAELSAFYRKTESATDAIKRAIKAQRNLDTLHKQMDKIFEDLNKARKLIETTEKELGLVKDNDKQTVKKSGGTFSPLQGVFSRRQLQKAEITLKKVLNESKTLQKAIDTAQTEYETARDTWKTIVYGTSQKTQ